MPIIWEILETIFSNPKEKGSNFHLLFLIRACFGIIRMIRMMMTMITDDEDGDSEHSKTIWVKILKIAKDKETLIFSCNNNFLLWSFVLLTDFHFLVSALAKHQP